MMKRSSLLTAALALASLTAIQIQTAQGQTAPKKLAVPRTADGKPDLQGIWTNATLTPLERPAAVAGKATLTDAEAAVWEKNSVDVLKKYDGKAENPFADAAGSGGTGGYNALFIDQGSELARVDGVKRTSLVIDPPNGKVPPITTEARARNAALARGSGGFDSARDRPLGERCLMSFGSSAGPPMVPVLYNNNYEIVQTHDHVVILTEMVHDARIIRMNAKHAPTSVRQWMGDSIGKWDGDTLVVDTTNFTNQTRFRGSGENLHVVERFTRVDQNTILYRATIEESATFPSPWTIEYPFVATKGPIYEYACHEGNYSMADILGGARKAEQEKK